MLSTSIIKNVDQAAHYFSKQDNYYTREEGFEQSEWFGRGAEKLNLYGKVDDKTFTELLQGKLHNGEQIGKIEDGKIKHRPGWDLTFSAPKSVSIMAFIGGDKRLIEAHHNAVKVALSHIEKSCSQARIKLTDEMKYQNTNSIISALFHHDLSREKDPQLHTHAVTMNITQRLDGKWRSQASQSGRYALKAQREINGFYERVNHCRRYYSKIYETELAYQVKGLGYEITTDTKSGKFEIVGVSPETIQFFSKRRKQIEKALDENGLSGGKAANIAALATRNAKDTVDRVELKEEWDKNAKGLGLNCQDIIKNTYEDNRTPKTPELDHQILGAIKSAARSLSVFQTTFTLEEVITEAADYAVRHSFNFTALLTAVNAEISSGNLMSIPNDQGKTILMAKATLEDEKQLFIRLKDQKMLSPTVDPIDLINFLNQRSEIKVELHEYLRTIFNNDRIVLIEGKETRDILLAPIMQVARASDLNVVILSPNLVGSKSLANRLKPASQNIWERIKYLFVDQTPKHYSVMQFLSEHEVSSNKGQPNILIVDNAHLLSTYQKANLVEWNVKHQTKLILLGEKQMLLSQQIGMGLHDFEASGIKTISLPNNTQDEQTIFNKSLNKISGQINEVKHQDDRLYAMASHYSRLSDQNRTNSWLIAHSKQSVGELNQLTHETLKEKQKLIKGKNVDVLIPVFLTDDKSRLASHFHEGQVVRFNETYPSLGVERGEYLRVSKTHKASNRVVLKKNNGKEVIWAPDKVAGGTAGKVELFSEITREFCVGEIIVLHRSIKSQKVVKGERLTISNIQGQTIKLKTNEGKSIVLDLGKYYHRHMDYGYASTPHAIAHERPHALIAELPAKAFHTDQRRFYQIVSQPREAYVYTDDHKGLIAHLEKKTGDRLSVHDTLSKAEEIKKNLYSLYDVLETQLINQKRFDNAFQLSRSAVNAIEYAMYHLSERNAGFTHKQLLEVAMEHALGKVTPETLDTATIALEKSGILLRGIRPDGTLWTTADAVKIEREIIALSHKDQGKLEPIANEELLAKFCCPMKLAPEQIDAVRAIALGRDRVLAIQGHPGTGKTTLFATIADILAAKEVLSAQGHEILGLAPTHVAVKELINRGIKAQTLDSFIVDMKNEMSISPIKRGNLILIVDEASMVSNRKMLDVLQIAHQIDCRLVPAGDTRQLASIESGKPHDLIQNSGVHTQHLIQIKRQKNDSLKQAVKETINYDFKAAFTALRNSIQEISMEKTHHRDEMADWNIERMKRVETLVNDYFSYEKDKRDQIQVITPGHDDRVLANSLIRDRLKEEGTLVKENDQTFSILSSKNFTHVERSHVENLSIGDVLRFNKRESYHIKASSYFTITEMNKDHSIIKLRNMEGREVAWQVPKFDKKRLSKIEVFKIETRDAQVGDILRWTKTDKEHHLLGSEAAKIVAVDQKIITVELVNQKHFTFDSNNPRFQHWDHGYAATVYAAQGKTKEIVLAHLESFRDNLTTQPAFLVALTRSVNEFRLYTDSIPKLLKSIEKNTGTKLSSLEVIGEYPNKPVKKTKSKEIHLTLANTVVAGKLKQKNNKKVLNYLSYFNRSTISSIKEGLNQHAEKIAIDFLGNPKEKGVHYLKFGSNQGSLSVTIKGEKQGWFYDFDTNQGGRDMLKFIQVYGGMNRNEAIKYGANWLGMAPNQGIDLAKISKKNHIKNHDLAKKNEIQAFSIYEKKRIKWANQLARESKAIKGTLAETYLKKYRGVNIEHSLHDIRFHPKIYCKKNKQALPAVLGIARDQAGNIQSVEAIYLDPKTGDKADVPLKKQTIGPKKWASIVIHQTHDPNAPTLLAEGTVTGLSLARALPHVNVSITLGKGMYAHIDPKKLPNKVIFCLDNDGKNLQSDKVIFTASHKLIESKKEVSFMVPNGLNIQKQDYNDILKQIGVGAIQRDFHQAVSYVDFYSSNNNERIKMKNNIILPNQKVIQKIIRDEKYLSSSVIKEIISEEPLSPHLYEKKISHFAKNFTKGEGQESGIRSHAYKALHNEVSQKETTTSVQINQNIKHDIER